MFENLEFIDVSILLGYFVLVFIVAFWSSKKSGQSTDDYFLGSKNLGWFVIGASLFASNIGSEHLIGLAGQGASGEFVAGQFELLASIILTSVLGYLLAKKRVVRPAKYAVVGAVVGIFPPGALLFLLLLFLKEPEAEYREQNA